MVKHQQLTAEFDAYLEGKLRVVLEALVEQLLLEKPADVQSFARDFLAKRHNSEKAELQLLRTERDSLLEKRDRMRSQIAKGSGVADTEEGEQGEEDLPPSKRREERSLTALSAMEAEPQVPASAEDIAAEEARVKASQARPRRRGVAAQAVSQEDVSNYKKPIYPKEPEQVAEIKQTLKDNDKMQVLLGHLSGEALDDVVNAFHFKEIDQGSDIIVQGATGDCLYIISSGSVDVFVARPGPDGAMPVDKGTKVVSYSKGALFGELALMYNAPRAATVTATDKVGVWVLDATDFKMLLMQQGQSQYKKYEGWLSEVELLTALNNYELSKLADALQTAEYAKGEELIKQGDVGDRFFILEKGSAHAYMSGDAGEFLARSYEEMGNYFGEVALLKEAPRKASVRAGDNGCAVAYLSKDRFIQLLGPVNEVLKQHVEMYPPYEEVKAAT